MCFLYSQTFSRDIKFIILIFFVICEVLILWVFFAFSDLQIVVYDIKLIFLNTKFSQSIVREYREN